MRVRSTFESLTVWNLERPPEGGDSVILAFGWPKIAEGVSAEIGFRRD